MFRQKRVGGLQAAGAHFTRFLQYHPDDSRAPAHARTSTGLALAGETVPAVSGLVVWRGPSARSRSAYFRRTIESSLSSPYLPSRGDCQLGFLNGQSVKLRGEQRQRRG